MPEGTPSPPPGRRVGRAFSGNGRSDRQPRELSPWSARRAITEQMQREQSGGAVPTDDTDGRRPQRAAGRSELRQNGTARPPQKPARGGRDKSTPPPHTKPLEPETVSPREPKRHARRESSREPTVKHDSLDAPLDAPAKLRDRHASPEPYRKSLEPSGERTRHRSKDRRRDRSRDMRHDPSSGKRRDRSTDRRRDRSRDKDRDKRRDRSRDRDRVRDKDEKKDGKRDRSQGRDREKDRRRDRSRDKDQDRKRDRSRDRRRHRSHSRDRKDRRSRSPLPYRSKRRSPSASTSPPPKRRRRTRSPSRSPVPRSKKPLPSQEISFRGTSNSDLPPTKYGGAPTTLEKPNFKPTGLLAKAANKVEGTKISLKYHEPAEARKPPPSAQWRIFVFKGDDVVDTIELHTRSCWLLGRAHEVVDYVLEHPSSSSQHAVIQFRYIQKTVEDEFGVKKQRGKVKPYIIDLESSNGTELNGERIETSRYLELRDKDILKFAGSEREFVIMLPPPEEVK